MVDEKLNLRAALRMGLIGGLVALAVSAIGMAELFAQRALVAQVITLGHLMVFAAPAFAGYLAADAEGNDSWAACLLRGSIAGIVSAIPLLIMIGLSQAFDIREYLVNVSPALVELLTFGRGVGTGSLLLTLTMTAISLGGAFIRRVPDRVSDAILAGLLWTVVIGLLSEVLQGRFRDWFGSDFVKLVFSAKALRIGSAAFVFSGAAVAKLTQERRETRMTSFRRGLSDRQQRLMRWGLIAAGILGLLLLPAILGTYLSEVIDNIGIYVLMGLGLNIVVGFAGLLDLGYVAFFAIGAYVMAVLTSEGALGISAMGFWAALPFSVGASVLAGILLGIPVLRMRGDYLAIVTLGFGEIIRILALSDLFKPYIGGAQGVLQIPKPVMLGTPLIKPGQLYYVILAGCLLAVFVSWRLADSRLGRQWKALREDEDVAEAMGIRLVSTKLLAFGIGAGFSGLSGAIFASKLTSIFPHSFNLLISINVLSLIIVGGIASLPGVVVGALVLVGLPELLREFNEYRLLMYGALLIIMMIAKPEGFWPSQVRRRELHAGEQEHTSGMQPTPAEAGD